MNNRQRKNDTADDVDGGRIHGVATWLYQSGSIVLISQSNEHMMNRRGLIA
jgi:hypothetical protein